MISSETGTVNLILVACSQLPIGCSDTEMELNYQNYYKPLAQLADRFPQSAWTIHLGGELLEWVSENHPELTMLLREMVERRQLEPLGGGYYAPVLPIIPALDRVGQIEKLTTALRVRFGTRPRGVWLSDCVWEPSLPHTLARSGMEYTFLDRSQFVTAGVRGDALYRAHLTEDEGRVLTVIPIHFRISQLMESSTPEDALKALVSTCSSAGERVVVVVDEPEQIRDYRWLEGFLRLVDDDHHILPTTPRSYLRRHGTQGFVYLDCGMAVGCQSVLAEGAPKHSNTSVQDASVKSGVFRRQLSSCADSRLLYAKMFHSNLLVNQVRGDREKRRAAREDLWRGQCGHAYWNRPGGGISSRRTRDAAYASLLRAEVQARDGTSFMPSIIRADHDMDGVSELLYHSRIYNAYVHTVGGMLFELDYLPCSVNFMNTLTPNVSRVQGSTGKYLRRGFLDHFLPTVPTVSGYISGFESETNLVTDPYVVTAFEDDRLTLLRSGLLIPKEGSTVVSSADLRKSYRFRARSMEVRYDVVAESDVDAWLAVETNIAVSSSSSWKVTGPRSSRQLKGRSTSLGPISLVEIDDPVAAARVAIRAGDAQAGVYVPVDVASEFQYFGLVIAWRLRAIAGERWTRRLSISLSRG